MAPIQSALDLQLATTYHASDFVRSKSNDEAYQWINQWPQWPIHCLLLYGARGCGKTHLAHIWAQKTGAQLLTTKQLATLDLGAWSDNPQPLVLENINKDIDQEQLLHL